MIDTIEKGLYDLFERKKISEDEYNSLVALLQIKIDEVARVQRDFTFNEIMSIKSETIKEN